MATVNHCRRPHLGLGGWFHVHFAIAGAIKVFRPGMPNRLRRPSTLRAKARLMPGWRWRLIARTPTVLIDYLLEVLIAAISLIAGGAMMSGFSNSVTIRQLPEPLVIAFGALYWVAAATMAAGLLLGRHGTLLPQGLRLFAALATAYLFAIIGYAGWRSGIITALYSTALTLLALWRAFLLRSTYLLLLGEAGDRTPP